MPEMTTKIEKDPSCRDDFDPKSLSADAALEQILSGVSRIKGIEKIAIRETLNRILAEDIRSRINVPSGPTPPWTATRSTAGTSPPAAAPG